MTDQEAYNEPLEEAEDTLRAFEQALFEAVEFGKGELVNGSMRDYRVPRFKDVPPIDIILLDRPDLPSAGAGASTGGSSSTGSTSAQKAL